MSKKFVSFILTFVLIFSLIPNMPTYGMGEQVETNEKNQIAFEISASSSIDAVIKGYEAELEYLKILAEQEELITPEIRASMRENAIKAFEAYGLTNKDFAIKNAKPTDYGFKTQKELDLWLAEPYNPYKASAVQSDDTPLSMNYSEYALVVGGMFCLGVNGYTNASSLAWMIFGSGGSHTRLRDWPGGNQEKFVDGLSVGTDAIVVTDEVKGNTGCVVEVISLDLSCGKRASIKAGESLTISATTSHSNGQIAIRSTSSNVSISGTTVTGLTEGSASIVVYLVDRPTVYQYVTLTITAPDPTVSFEPTQRMQYYGDPFTLYPTTNPPGLDITWSVYPEDRGYFVGNTFYPTNTGGVRITATIAGTSIKSSYVYFINTRNIILPQTEITLMYYYNGYFPLNVSIDHGSIDDISYSVSGNAVSNIVKINGQPYFTVQNVGESIITMTAPGCNESKTLKVIVEPDLYFVNPPSEIRAGSDYTITVFSNTPAEVWQYFFDPDTGDSMSNLNSYFDEVISGGAGYYSFVLHAGNAGEHFGLAVQEDATGKAITLEYTVLPEEPVTEDDTRSIKWSTTGLPQTARIYMYDEGNDTYTRTAIITDIVDGERQDTTESPEYSSDNESIAVVDGNGKVIPIDAGTTTIRARIPNSTIELSYTVEVERELYNGAALYRVPFEKYTSIHGYFDDDIGTTSDNVIAFENLIRSHDNDYNVYVQNGSKDQFTGIERLAFCGAMANSKIFFFESHGRNDDVVIKSNWEYIDSSQLSNTLHLSASPNALSYCNLIIISACQAGGGTFGSKIIGASPKIVIGMNRNVTMSELEDYFSNCLFPQLSQGKTVEYIRNFTQHYYSFVTFYNESDCDMWVFDDILNK